MTTCEWEALVAAGRQAEHQALELLARPLRPWEAGTLAEVYRAWALAVLQAAK
jgi:hypothetical protein